MVSHGSFNNYQGQFSAGSSELGHPRAGGFLGQLVRPLQDVLPHCGKINIDEEPDLAAQFRVMSIPTAMLFENGQVKETLVGVQPKARLEAMTK